MTTPSRTCSRCGYTNGVLGDFNFANNRSEHLCQRFFGGPVKIYAQNYLQAPAE